MEQWRYCPATDDEVGFWYPLNKSGYIIYERPSCYIVVGLFEGTIKSFSSLDEALRFVRG